MIDTPVEPQAEEPREGRGPGDILSRIDLDSYLDNFERDHPLSAQSREQLERIIRENLNAANLQAMTEGASTDFFGLLRAFLGWISGSYPSFQAAVDANNTTVEGPAATNLGRCLGRMYDDIAESQNPEFEHLATAITGVVATSGRDGSQALQAGYDTRAIREASLGAICYEQIGFAPDGTFTPPPRSTETTVVPPPATEEPLIS